MFKTKVILIVSALIIIQTVKGNLPRQQYSIDTIEADWNVTSHHNLEMNWTVTRPSRGVYGLNGLLHFKKDINTDNVTAEMNIYYSPSGIGYTLSAFRYPPKRFTDFMNDIYKNYAMEKLKESCENCIQFEGIFKSPLKKIKMVCTNWIISNEQFPSHLRMGYYRLEFYFTGEFEAYIMYLLHLESN